MKNPTEEQDKEKANYLEKQQWARMLSTKKLEKKRERGAD